MLSDLNRGSEPLVGLQFHEAAADSDLRTRLSTETSLVQLNWPALGLG